MIKRLGFAVILERKYSKLFKDRKDRLKLEEIIFSSKTEITRMVSSIGLVGK